MVEGKPTASAQLIGALVRMAGHRLRVTGNDTEAHAQVIRSDDPDFAFESVWTLDRAARAGLTGKGVWKSYPAAMLKRAPSLRLPGRLPGGVGGVAFTPLRNSNPPQLRPRPPRPAGGPQSPPTTVTVATGVGPRNLSTPRPADRRRDVIEDQAQPDDATADYLRPRHHPQRPPPRRLGRTAQEDPPRAAAWAQPNTTTSCG